MEINQEVKLCYYDPNIEQLTTHFNAFDTLNKDIGDDIDEFDIIKHRLMTRGIYDGVLSELFYYYKNKNGNMFDDMTILILSCSHFQRKI
jgi:hypothetical protein